MTDPAGNAVEELAFDSDKVAPDRRVALYQELYAGGADVVATGPDFRAVLCAWRLDRLLLFTRHLNDLSHSRDAARVAHDGFDHMTVTMVRDGDFRMDTGQGLRPVLPGQAIVCSMKQPMRHRCNDTRIVTISVARRRVAAIAPDLERLHGHVIGVQPAALLFSFVESLLPGLSTMSARGITATSAVIATLLTVALEDEQAVHVSPDDAARDGRLDMVRALVDARLGDSAFNADAIVAESGLARATLYRLFQSEGGIAAYLRGRRLERVRRDLSLSEDTRSFGAIAADAGFASESHGSRAFRDRYGMRPGDYRAMVARTGPESDGIHRMRLWIDEVR